MCWNKEVSLSTAIISLGSILVYLKRVGMTGEYIRYFPLLLSIPLMQLLEYLIWSDQDCRGVNQLASKLGFLLILIQPLMAGNALIGHPCYLPFMAVCLLFIYDGLGIAKDYVDEKWCTKRSESSPHLNWKWFEYFERGPVQAPNIVLLTLLLLPGILGGNYTGLGFYLVTYGLSYYMYRDSGVYGSLWYWLCNFGVMYLLIAKS